MSSTWSGLWYQGEDNLGGNRIAHVALVEWFTSLPAPTTRNVVELAPVFVNTGWFWLRFTLDSAGFSEKQVNGVGGPAWDCVFKCFCPGDSVESRSMAEEWVRMRWVIQVTDANGLIRRMGDLRNPARLSYDFTTDDATTGRRGYLLTFTWSNDRPAPIVEVDPDNDGTYTVIPPGEVNPGSGASG